MFDHPQVLAQHMVHEYPHPAVGSYRGLARPIQFDRKPAAALAAAPALGQHTEQVLRGNGWSEAELDGLRAVGVLPRAA